MKIFDWLAASAVEEPEMPAKNSDSTTLICARPPGQWPTMVRDSFRSRSVMPPMFIRLAVSRKNGTASRMKELKALKLSDISVTVSRRGSMSRIGRQARPSAKATGTRSAMSAKKDPNRTKAACRR